MHGQQAPAEELRVELTAPSGETWTWGDEDAAQRVTGSAYDFCLLVTQRIHRDDTDLVATGADAEHWLGIAQAFAGPSGEGRERVVSEPIRIGNCSGFYGDRLSAMREMLEGGQLDVLTGDYLAELTMLILGKDTMKDPTLGYARTFVRQVEDCLGLALERGVRIVSNAGGLNPAGLADRLREVARGLGLDPAIAHVEGDDLRGTDLGFPGALTANAYLGGFGIAAGARSRRRRRGHRPGHRRRLVVGPAAAHYGWDPTSYDALAGAVVAGHVIECGTQATGGNFSGFRTAAATATCRSASRSPRWPPTARAVITKHAGTGGAVTVDTVTAQLVYEIQTTRYLGPDVTAHLDTVALAQDGPGPGRGQRRPRRAAARAAQGLRQRARRLPQQRRARAHRPRHRGQGRLGPRAADGLARRPRARRP